MTFYLAMKQEQIIGIFTTREKAEETEPDRIAAVEPAQLADTPDYTGYVMLAEGAYSTLYMNSGKLTSEVYDAGPSWGINVQSAIAGLFGPMYTRQRISLDRLTIFEADRVYADAAPQMFQENNPFRFIADRICEYGSMPEALAAEDYYALYLERKCRLDERIARRAIREGEMISAYLMELAKKEAFRRGVTQFGEVQLERAEGRIQNKLHDTFSPAQLRCLVWLLKLADDTDPQRESVPADMHASLLEKVHRMVPRLKRQRSMAELDELFAN